MIVGLIRDLSNYFYTRGRFDLAMDNEVLMKTYGLNQTPLGVMYTIRKFPIGTPDQYMAELIASDLDLLDQSLMALNLDGVVRMEYREVGRDEDDKYYLIKFIPVFTTGRLGVLRDLVLLTAGGWLLYHHRVVIGHWAGEVWQYLRHRLGAYINT